MSESQRQRAIDLLYATSELRSELTDDEAAPLLRWGESQVTELAQRGLDDAAFDEAFTHLSGVISRINRYVGGQSYLPASDSQRLLEEIAAEARFLGADVPPGGIFLAQSAIEPGNIATIHALTGLLAPNADPPPMPPDLPEWPDSHG
jgi:hypothetical protein